MRNGLYAVRFQTPIGAGGGVVFASGGTLRGGDSSIYYLGTYTTNGDQLTADVQFATHLNIPGLTSVFGVPQGTINLTGTVSGDSVSTKGSSPAAPGLAFDAHLRRIAD